ncbi:ATP-binding protein [Luteococcus peritonei]|uniref:Sensor histidine kinase n=1 Tax=Luteococcus peritonei TaxID=88874 RepID=A0ABW4RUV8_9ACTN
MSHAAPSGTPVPQHDPTDAALRLVGVLTLLVTAATTTIPMVLQLGTFGPLALAGGIGLLVNQATCLALLLWPRHRRPRQPWLMLAGLTVTLLPVVQHRYELQPSDLWAPGYWALPLVVLSLASQRRRAYHLFAALGTVAMLAVDALGMVQADWTPTPWTLADNLFVCLPLVEVLLFGDALLMISRARRRSAERRLLALASQRREQAGAESRREAARLLHDHVLHALNAIAQDRATVGIADVAEECRVAHEALTRAHPASSSVTVEDLLAEDPTLAAAGAQVMGASHPVPAVVAAALAAATREAVGNVTRHARARTCLVHVARLEQGVQVDISDDGRGFDPHRVPISRLGIRRSMVQRMEDIGGQATVTSTPGDGTRISLRWPRQGSADDGGWGNSTEGLARRLLTRTAWPGLANGLLLTVLMGPTLPHPRLAVALGLLTCLVGCLAASAASRRNLGHARAVALMTFAGLVWALNLWMVPQRPESSYALWLAWSTSAIAHLVVLAGRTRAGVAVVVSWFATQVVGLLLRYGVDPGLWRMTSLVTIGSGEVAITLLAMVVARRILNHDAADAELAEQVRAATARRQAAEHLEEHWSARVTGEALPLLLDVSRGLVDVSDDEVRRTARAMEVALRDELVLGHSRTGLLGALAGARADGWRLVSTLTPEDTEAALEHARLLLGELGPAAFPGQPLTLSSSGGQALAVTLECSEQQTTAWAPRIAALGGRLTVDPDFVRITVPGQRAGTGPSATAGTAAQ